MSPQRRNIVVGITVLGGLLGLTIMLLEVGGGSVTLFGGKSQMHIHFTSTRVDGLAQGSQVTYQGFPVGQITRLLRDANGQDVDIDGFVDNSPPLPANLTAVIKGGGLLGGTAVMSLEVAGGPDAKPTGRLEDNRTIRATYMGTELIPPQFTAVATQMSDAQLAVHMDQVVLGVRNYLNDPQIQQNIRESLDHIRHASESIDKDSEHVGDLMTEAHGTLVDTRAEVDRLSHQINDRMQQIDKLLATAQALGDKANSGQGSAGLLMNDPKLYESLVDNSRQLNLTILDLKRLVEQWEQEGVSFKLK